MSKVPFTVRTLRSVKTSKGPPLTKEANQPLRLNVTVPSGRVHIVLEFQQTYKVKNVIYKNAGAASEREDRGEEGAREGSAHESAASCSVDSSSLCLSPAPSSSFLSVYAGTSSDFDSLASADDPFTVLNQLPTLIAETQLCAASQCNADTHNPANAATSPLYRIKPFPAMKASRYVRERAYKFLILELKPFYDGAPPGSSVPVGCSWIEVYGEAGSEEEEDSRQVLETQVAAANARLTTNAALAFESQQAVATPAKAAASSTNQGAAAFRPTGAAERELQQEEARMGGRAKRQREEIPSTTAAASATPTPATAASSAPKPPPVCPRHPTHHSLLQRIDRKSTPPRTYYVCPAKDANGNSCDTKIYAD